MFLAGWLASYARSSLLLRLLWAFFISLATLPPSDIVSSLSLFSLLDTFFLLFQVVSSSFDSSDTCINQFICGFLNIRRRVGLGLVSCVLRLRERCDIRGESLSTRFIDRRGRLVKIVPSTIGV